MPEHRELAGELLASKVPLELQIQEQTPVQTQVAVSDLAEEFGGLYYTTLSAVVLGRDPINLRPRMDDNVVADIEDAVNESFKITVPKNHPVTKRTRKGLAKLNEGVQDARETHASQIFLRDRPSADMESIYKIAGGAVAAGLAAGALNNLGGPAGAGLALASASQLDDGLGALAVAKTEQKGGKPFSKITKENKLVGYAIASGVGLDFVLPPFLQSDKWYISLPASVGYFYTTTAGSMAATYKHHQRVQATIKKFDIDIVTAKQNVVF